MMNWPEILIAIAGAASCCSLAPFKLGSLQLKRSRVLSNYGRDNLWGMGGPDRVHAQMMGSCVR
jgi:hypothetical protein